MSAANQIRLQQRSRWLPAALAVALVAAQGSTVAHFVLVRHAYCADHGELVHPDGAAQGTAHGHASKVPALKPAEERDGHGHGHDHCVVVGHRRNALAAARADVISFDRSEARELLSSVLVAPTCEPRFRLAPKQSPPA